MYPLQAHLFNSAAFSAHAASLAPHTGRLYDHTPSPSTAPCVHDAPHLLSRRSSREEEGSPRAARSQTRNPARKTVLRLQMSPASAMTARRRPLHRGALLLDLWSRDRPRPRHTTVLRTPSRSTTRHSRRQRGCLLLTCATQTREPPAQIARCPLLFRTCVRCERSQSREIARELSPFRSPLQLLQLRWGAWESRSLFQGLCASGMAGQTWLCPRWRNWAVAMTRPERVSSPTAMSYEKRRERGKKEQIR